MGGATTRHRGEQSIKGRLVEATMMIKGKGTMWRVQL